MTAFLKKAGEVVVFPVFVFFALSIVKYSLLPFFLVFDALIVTLFLILFFKKEPVSYALIQASICSFFLYSFTIYPFLFFLLPLLFLSLLFKKVFSLLKSRSFILFSASLFLFIILWKASLFVLETVASLPNPSFRRIVFLMGQGFVPFKVLASDLLFATVIYLLFNRVLVKEKKFK